MSFLLLLVISGVISTTMATEYFDLETSFHVAEALMTTSGTPLSENENIPKFTSYLNQDQDPLTLKTRTAFEKSNIAENDEAKDDQPVPEISTVKVRKVRQHSPPPAIPSITCTLTDPIGKVCEVLFAYSVECTSITSFNCPILNGKGAETDNPMACATFQLDHRSSIVPTKVASLTVVTATDVQ